MPLTQYQFPINEKAGAELISRGFGLSYPIDWKELTKNGQLLPVILFFHGGNQSPMAFITTGDEGTSGFNVPNWWNGDWNGFDNPGVPPIPGYVPAGLEPLKAIVIAFEGVSFDSDGGGDWNGGNMGADNRLAQVNDEAYVIDALARAEALLVEAWLNEPPVLPEGQLLWSPGQIFDRERLSIVGFSEGGQMAYRMANVLRFEGWEIKALAVFSSSIGGFRKASTIINNPGATPDVDWTPTVPSYAHPTLTSLRAASLLHVHGVRDPRINWDKDGVSQDTQKAAESQAPGKPAEFERWDFCGHTSATKYSNVLAGVLGLGVSGAYPLAIQNATPNSFSVEWRPPLIFGATPPPPKRVIYAEIAGLGQYPHRVPSWGYQAVIEFFLSVGAL